ncbi:NAD(P)/FAD-dependent oxidoreductase [Roseibacillus ishigakijimensis]|uniref:FAD-dependent oxidoreductase n=1 Tax=Roseibacillus ishigakijimensis TaxID=454146 RepID=A0A934RQB5_9BACT|nr:FAD-dependent oxidoreductase [Roseibacillus ishigakijimensis]MBK1833139.1 FAD-dependent oxidoreductase [Roseibacillus ishigakijimensis]
MQKEGKSVVVIGGGVVGLASAYYLTKAGRRVTVVERDASLASGCSEGNAGMIVPSHFIPLAAPGVIGQGLKWMLNPKSPFFLRPRLDPALARWLWLFARHANAGHVKRSEELLRDLGLESRRLHVELARASGFSLQERGLLMLCQSEAGLAEEAEVAEEAKRLGLQVEVFGKERLRDFEPDARVEALGGVWFEQDCHLRPLDFVEALRQEIAAAGGVFLAEEGTDFVEKNGRVVALRTTKGSEVAGDQFVLAGGIASLSLAKRLGLKLPMQGGKGYSLTLKKPRKAVQICSLLKEGRVAVTPMGDSLRVAGTMEICGSDTSLNRTRLQGVIESFCRFYPDFSPEDFVGIEPWVGLRPCSPDGLPYLGRVPGRENVIIATGHAMMGLSLAPVTGSLVEKIVAGDAPGIEIAGLNPTRFG